jgi:hypothetical protein
MAKRFGGFTPEQMGKIIPEMQGMQTDEQAKFLASQPGAAARVGKMSELAEKRINMAYGGYVKGYAAGGMATDLDTAQQTYAESQKALQAARDAQAANPEDTTLQDTLTSAEANVNLSQEGVTSAEAAFKATEVPTSTELVAGAINDPSSMITKTDVALNEVTDEQIIDPATGQLKDPAPTVSGTTAETASDVQAPDDLTAETVDTTLSTPAVSEALDSLEAAQGTVSDDATVDAATMSPQDLAQLELEADQIDKAQTVDAPDPRTLQDGELIEGSTVDMDRVKKEINFQAATGAPSTDATVQGQLTGLMEQFEGKDPPAWAAGAMRAAGAAMASRGLSASSMAGQAVVQAAMESALPIAMQDAQTNASFEAQNLSNKQQSAMFAAEKRAEFMGMEFTQEFQSRVANAAKISDIANMNFTAEQQVALENARMAQTVDLTNLNSVNAKIMADAASMSQADMANLNNRQQSQAQNAKAFLDMDMANLNNNQQTTLFKAQQRTNTLLSDQAAMNAAKQFNASSENQTNQFFSNLSANVALANTEQTNAMNRFNAGESNAISQYNATARTAREQFNANNAVVVAQANAAWSQAITTADTAAQNQSNRDAAVAATGMTTSAYNSVLQQERDMINYSFQMGESAADRANSIVLQGMINSVSQEQMQANLDEARGAGWAKAGMAVLDWWLNPAN